MDEGDGKEVATMWRKARWTKEGIEHETDPTRRERIWDCFGFEEGAKSLSHDGEGGQRRRLGTGGVEQARSQSLHWGFAATFNFIGQDCHNIQFPTKQ